MTPTDDLAVIVTTISKLEAERDAARAEVVELKAHKADWKRMCDEAQDIAAEAIDQRNAARAEVERLKTLLDRVDYRQEQLSLTLTERDAARQVARELAAKCETCSGVGHVVRDGIGPREASIVSERCPKCGPIREANPWLSDVAQAGRGGE